MSDKHDQEGCAGSWEQYGTSRKCADCKKPMAPLPSEKTYIVRNSISFREAVMELHRQNQDAYLYTDSTADNSYRIVVDWVPSLNELLHERRPTLPMEYFAVALSRAERRGEEIPDLLVTAYGGEGGRLRVNRGD